MPEGVGDYEKGTLINAEERFKIAAFAVDLPAEAESGANLTIIIRELDISDITLAHKMVEIVERDTLDPMGFQVKGPEDGVVKPGQLVVVVSSTLQKEKAVCKVRTKQRGSCSFQVRQVEILILEEGGDFEIPLWLPVFEPEETRVLIGLELLSLGSNHRIWGLSPQMFAVEQA